MTRGGFIRGVRLVEEERERKMENWGNEQKLMLLGVKDVHDSY